MQYGEVRLDRHGEHGGVGQFQPHPNRYKSDLTDQSPDGTHVCRRREDRNTTVTPKRKGITINKRKLFEGIKIDEGGEDVVPLDTDLEVLLTLKHYIRAHWTRKFFKRVVCIQVGHLQH